MDRSGERPPTWMWVCRTCEEEGFVEPPEVCPNCGASGETWFEWFPLEAR